MPSIFQVHSAVQYFNHVRDLSLVARHGLLRNSPLIATSHRTGMGSEIDEKGLSFYLKMLLCIRSKDSDYLPTTFYPFNDAVES